MSSTGRCFDIGHTTSTALHAYRKSGNPCSGSTHPGSAGNGSIMRLAPVPMFFASSLEQTLRFAGESSRTTHGAAEAVDATKLFSAQIRSALLGSNKMQILEACGYEPIEPAVQRIAACDYASKTEAQISGSGYVIESLEAALWCFLHTDSYAAATLRAANLGNDADTTAAVCGQLAGAHYGAGAIPKDWRRQLAMREHLEELAVRLLAERI
jgi:ADP-ribosyl-[dinitrogen reductase] hydrolase